MKIFKFPKTRVIDLTETPERFCNVIECGRDRFTLKDFKLQDGHDDSIPYSATLCVNGKPLCKCVNDGWGGVTELTAIDIAATASMASLNINLPKFRWSYRGTEFGVTLDFIADVLASTAKAALNKC